MDTVTVYIIGICVLNVSKLLAELEQHWLQKTFISSRMNPVDLRDCIEYRISLTLWTCQAEE